MQQDKEWPLEAELLYLWSVFTTFLRQFLQRKSDLEEDESVLLTLAIKYFVWKRTLFESPNRIPFAFSVLSFSISVSPTVWSLYLIHEWFYPTADTDSFFISICSSLSHYWILTSLLRTFFSLSQKRCWDFWLKLIQYFRTFSFPTKRTYEGETSSQVKASNTPLIKSYWIPLSIVDPRLRCRKISLFPSFESFKKVCSDLNVTNFVLMNANDDDDEAIGRDIQTLPA